MSFPPASIKAAQLADAARRSQPTIRKLVWDGLQLGDRQSPGHPRYTLSDVVRLLLVEELQLAGIEPVRRIEMVNSISSAVDEAVDSICSEIEAKGEHVTEGGPWAIFGRIGSAMQSYVTSLPEEIAGSAANHNGILIIVRLRQSIHKAYHRLGRVDMPGLPEVSE